MYTHALCSVLLFCFFFRLITTPCFFCNFLLGLLKGQELIVILPTPRGLNNGIMRARGKAWSYIYIYIIILRFDYKMKKNTTEGEDLHFKHAHACDGN